MASELIQRDMYSGRFHLVHNPNARGSQPRYVLTDKASGEIKKPKGTTTVLGATLSKDLMGWAVNCMKEYLTAKLPNVSVEDLEDGASEYERRRDSGGATGTEAHALVEQYLRQTAKGADYRANPDTSSAEALNAYNAFVGWYEEVGAEVINVEEVIYSEEFDYAGTYDGMLRIDGKVYLTDFKTTNVSRKAPNGVYAEYFIQLGAYYNAHEEQRAYEEAHGGTELVKVDGLAVISGKKDGTLDVVTNDAVGLTIDQCADMFKQTINIYRFLANTTKTLGGK